MCAIAEGNNVIADDKVNINSIAIAAADFNVKNLFFILVFSKFCKLIADMRVVGVLAERPTQLQVVQVRLRNNFV